jgi:uncharacterized protein (DUF58 family)
LASARRKRTSRRGDLDWRLVARTDRYFIKKFEDETNLRCSLLVDGSRSMNFGSGGYTKAEYARTLAATLAYFLSHQGDATGLLTFDEQVREYLPARNRPGHLRHLMLALEKPAHGSSTDVAAPLRRIAELVRKRSLIVLISDLLAPIESLATSLPLLTASRHEVVVFQVIDPAERTFDFDQAARFLHMESVRGTCEGLGISHVLLDTSKPLEFALFDFLKARSMRGKLIRRKGAA